MASSYAKGTAAKESNRSTSEPKDNLQNIVVELSHQVKGLQGLITNEIQAKHDWQQQAFGLQDKYFQTIEDLKHDLVQFKSKIQEENKSMYSEFQS